MSDAFTPRTKIDDSQFQGIINIYTTERTVPQEKPLPAIGTVVTVEWGQFSNHVIIARGSSPKGNAQKTMWVVHLALPASFAAQDVYNWSKSGSDTISRFYVMKRADYLAVGYAATIPEAGTPDTLFPDFVFATETVSKIGSDPNSYFVAVERIYLLSPKVEKFHDDNLEAVVTRTTEVVPRGSASAASAAGTKIEVFPASEHHDIKVTSVLAGNYSSPRQLTTIPTDINYPFPPLLQGVELIAVWAEATSAEAARAYDEDWYFRPRIVRPKGPYEARQLRFLTTSPDSLRSIYPMEKIVTVDESIGIARWWAYASNNGNSTFAQARQIDIPEAIHGDIEIENAGGISVGQDITSLPATPGFDRFANSTSMVVGYEPQQVDFGLYLVSIIIVNTTGLYDGDVVPLGSPGGSTGAGNPPPGTNKPLLPTAVMAADNTTVSGVTSPYSEVTASAGNVVHGRAAADAGGSYTITLDPVQTDAVTLNIRARRNGASSGITPVLTRDLAPDAPDAVISSDLTRVSGITEPHATIHILVNAAAQVETVTIPANRPQVMTLTFAGPITADGDAEIDFTSFLVSVPDVLVPLTIGMTGAEMSAAARTALEATPANDHWAFAVNGDDLVATARVTDADDGTALMDLTDPNATGVGTGTSSATTPGNDAVLIFTDGTAIATVTSGIAGVGTRTVPFSVLAGDNPATVAAKAESALGLSVIAEHYAPGSSGSQVSLTALAPAAHDGSLAISIANGTCTGLIPTPASVTTVPGGTPVSTTANASGVYAYEFGAPLSTGDILQVTATDGGGTSAPTTVKANATPPVLNSAAFPALTYNKIAGTATIAAKVIAYLGNTAIGDAIADGSGDFEITLATPLTHGETVRVVAVDAGDETVRSSILLITALILNLEKPVFSETTAGYVGVAPVGATHIVYRLASGGAESFATLHANRNFIFTLPGLNGERYAVYARYAAGDSDPVYQYAATVALPSPKPFPVVYRTAQSASLNAVAIRYDLLSGVRETYRSGWPQFQTEAGLTGRGAVMWLYIPFYIAGMNVKITFPGSAAAAINDNPAAPAAGSDVRYTIAGGVPALMEVTVTVPDGRSTSASFDRGSAFPFMIYDLSIP